jgi:hypothetical protein
MQAPMLLKNLVRLFPADLSCSRSPPGSRINGEGCGAFVTRITDAGSVGHSFGCKIELSASHSSALNDGVLRNNYLLNGFLTYGLLFSISPNFNYQLSSEITRYRYII